MTQNTAPISAALLFGAGAALDLDPFEADLNARLTGTGIRLAADPSPLPGMVILRHPACQVVVAMNDCAFGADGFDDALAWGISSPEAPGFAETVANHRQHLLISVIAPAGQNGTAETPPHAALIVLHRAVLAMLKLSNPLAVYWAPSERILPLRDVMATVADPFPGNLLLYRDRALQAPGGAGVVIGGSAQFFGRTLIAAPYRGTDHAAEVLARSLLERHLARPLALRDGDTVALTAAETVYLRHLPGDEDCPQGYVRASHKPPVRPRPPVLRPVAEPPRPREALGLAARRWLHMGTTVAAIVFCAALALLFADTALDHLAGDPLEQLDPRRLH